MENTATLKKYELVVIIDAHLPNDQKEAVCKEVKDATQGAGAKVINSQVWMERHKFTFQIKKHKEGTYYLINLESDGSMNSKIRDELRLKENILRFAITKVD